MTNQTRDTRTQREAALDGAIAVTLDSLDLIVTENRRLRAENKRLREGISRLHAPIQWASGTYCEECGDEFPCLTRRITDHQRVPASESNDG